MQISHLLFTRFNIQFDQYATAGIQPEWLEDRIGLFETYCLPSVLRQTCRDFMWIIIGDVRTPQKYKTKIEQYTALAPNIRVLWWAFKAEDEDYHIPFSQLATDYAKNADVLITSRIDNDDTISPDYIQRIQEEAKKGIVGFITFPIGKQTFVHSHKSYVIRYVQNHFLSRVETSDFKTVMSHNHALIDKSNLYCVKTEQPMWEEIVHGGNVHNDFEPKYRYILHSWRDFSDWSIQWILFIRKRINRLFRSHYNQR